MSDEIFFETANSFNPLEMSDRRPVLFNLVLGATAFSDIDGLSAAGKDAAARRETARLDAGFLLKAGSTLPVSPQGITSPALITSVCLDLIDDASIVVTDCGTFDGQHPSLPPPHKSLRHLAGAAGLPFDKRALPLSAVRALYHAGQVDGGAHALSGLPVLAECVPGGTTTAALVLALLGHDCLDKLSSSVPDCARNLKRNVIESVLEKIYEREKVRTAGPLEAVSLVGDPMQAYATGYLQAASRIGPVIAAGGTQMLAVRALVSALGADCKNIAVVTTSHVARDMHADVQCLASQLGSSLVSIDMGLKASRHEGLRAYTRGHVKEGVGAGAAFMLAAQRHPRRTVLEAIDRRYSELFC